MIVREHPIRSALTVVGLVAFGFLAAGSEDDDHYVPAPVPAEEVGKQHAMDWARANSAALASKVQLVHAAQAEARREIYRLESLRDQFPEQASKISASISAWQQVLIKLDSALSEIHQRASEAYVASQVGESGGEGLLEEVTKQWAPTADAALAEAESLSLASGDGT